MRKVTTQDEFLALCERESQYRSPEGPYHPRLIGMVDAPPFVRTVAWVDGCTVGDAIDDHRRAINDYGVHYTPALGNSYTCARILYADPDLPCLPPNDTETGEEVVPEWPGDRREPWFPGGIGRAPEGQLNGPDLLKEWSDPDLLYGEAMVLSLYVSRALGYERWFQKPPEQQATLADIRASFRGRHVWIDGLFACDEEAALCICPLDEAGRVQAVKAATIHDVPTGDAKPNTEVINDLHLIALQLASSLRVGPGGQFLATAENVKQMQWGAAAAAMHFGYKTLGLEGDQRGIRFPVLEPVQPDAERGAPTDLVDGEKPAPDAKRTPRRQPARSG